MHVREGFAAVRLQRRVSTNDVDVVTILLGILCVCVRLSSHVCVTSIGLYMAALLVLACLLIHFKSRCLTTTPTWQKHILNLRELLGRPAPPLCGQSSDPYFSAHACRCSASAGQSAMLIKNRGRYEIYCRLVIQNSTISEWLKLALAIFWNIMAKKGCLGPQWSS